MRQYLDLCKDILENGTIKQDRTGTGTISVFGRQMRFDLSEGFPLMTTKDMGGKRLDGIIYELLWFLAGDTNIKYLVDNGVSIWNSDAYRNYKSKTREHTPLTKKDFVEQLKHSDMMAEQWGELGRVYGAQWRSWALPESKSDYVRDSIDQISQVIDQIKNNPDSRRHIVTAWNPADVEDAVLPPCHVLFQFYVADGKLSCQLYQRSGDVFLGVPYNIASYALLTMMIADQCGLGYGEFVHTLGDAHIYLNHVEQVKLQLTREPKELPRLLFLGDKPKDIFSYSHDSFHLNRYDRHPSIKGDVSVGN